MKLATVLGVALAAACLLPAAPASAELQPPPPDLSLLGTAKVQDYCVVVYRDDGSRSEIVCVPYGYIDRSLLTDLPG